MLQKVENYQDEKSKEKTKITRVQSNKENFSKQNLTEANEQFNAKIVASSGKQRPNKTVSPVEKMIN